VRCCACADYGFEYSDEEVVEDDVDIENQYYNSKGAPAGHLPPHTLHRKEGRLCIGGTGAAVTGHGAPGMLEGADPKDALRGFAEVVRMEPEKGEWCAALHLARAGALRDSLRHSLHRLLAAKLRGRLSGLTRAAGGAPGALRP